MLYPFLSLRTMWFGSVYSDLGNSVPSKTSPDFVAILTMLPTSALASLSRRSISPWYPSSPEADIAFLRPEGTYHYHLGPVILLPCHAFSLSYKPRSVTFVLKRKF